MTRGEDDHVAIRPYSTSDRAAVVALLAECLTQDMVNDSVFADRVLSDPDFDPALNLVAVLGERVVGFVAGAPANAALQCPAGAKLFAIAPTLRRRGLATRLFDQLEDRLRIQGASRCVAIGAGNNRLAQGLDVQHTPALCFLLGRGYERTGVTQDMVVDVQAASLTTEAAERAGSTFAYRRATAKDELWLKEGIERELEFPNPGAALGRRWAYLALQGLRRQPVSVHVAMERETGAFAGFVANHAARWGALGPMGVAERARGRGVGEILLKRALTDLRDEGHNPAEIYSVGPIPFYAKTVNATIGRVFYLMSKPLT